MRRTQENCTTQHSVKRLLGNCVLAAALALFAASCGDGPASPEKDGPVISGPLLAAGTPANGSGQCMGDDAVSFGLTDGIAQGTGDPESFVCEAEDIAIAEAIVTKVNGQDFDPNEEFECNEGEDITLAMTAVLDQTAESERQDIGIWIATDGGNAETGACNHYNLVAGTSGTTNLDGDQCAGMAEGASTSVPLGNVTVKCDDVDNDGFLDIGACVSWKVPADDQVCPNDADGNGTNGQPTDFRAGTLPSNKTKCNCEPFEVPIRVLKTATIEVKKVCVPTNDPGTFDLEIDNVGDDDYFLEDDAACGGTTGAQTVGAGSQSDPGADHSVSESDFTAANYTSTLSCTRNGSAFIPSEAYTAGTDRTVHVEPEDVIVCTFRNVVRRATVTVNKRENGALPLTRAWEFEIRTGATTSSAGTVRATGTASLTTGVVTFSCTPNPNAVCVNVGGVANFVPGAYQLCEINIPVGFSNDLNGFIPGGSDNSTECINITLSAGENEQISINNIPPPGGDARTIGYWRNWSSCTGGKQYQKAVARGEVDQTLDGNLPQLIGDFNITTCAQAVKLLSKKDQAGNNKANDAAYSLAAQLLAAKLNISAGAGTCAAANTAIANGQALLNAINFTGSGSYFPPRAGSIAGYTRTNALALAATLDSYNNNTLCP